MKFFNFPWWMNALAWIIVGVLMTLLILCCSKPTEPTPEPDPLTASSLSVLIKWGNAPEWDQPTVIDNIAQFDYVALTPGVWDYQPDVLDSLRTINPDIKLGTYFNIHTITHWMKDAKRESFPRALWDQLIPYYVRTTQRDTACIWMNQPLYDFTNPVVQDIAGQLLADYVKRNSLEWVFLDFFSVQFPDLKKHQAPIYDELENGDMDFDQNGIGYWDDPAEQAMVLEAQYTWMHRLRKYMPGILLIPNGDLAMKVDAFAAIGDGLFVENYAHWFFGSQDSEVYNSLDPSYKMNLHQLSGDRYATSPGVVMIQDKYNVGELSSIAMLFDGMMEVKTGSDRNGAYPFPTNIYLGDPVSPLITAVSDTLVLTREFEGGTHTVITIKQP